jgi:glucose-6-phosphate isomerase
MSNLFAQTEALAFGKTADEVKLPRARRHGSRRTGFSKATARPTPSWPSV